VSLRFTALWWGIAARNGSFAWRRYASPKRSVLISAVVHIAVFALLLATGKVAVRLPRLVDRGSIVLPSDLVKYQVTHTEGGSGAGGRHEPEPPQRGHLPKLATRVFVAPTARVENQQPVISMDMSIIGNPAILLPVTDLPFIGDPNGAPGSRSNGPGGPDGIGTGPGEGIGGHKGPGYGPDGDGGVGDPRTGFREDVTAPRLLSKVEPEYTDEARKARIQGAVMLRIVVDERGHAESIEVTRGLGLGLDERAIEAVKKWRFQPGMRGKRAVPTAAIVMVTFRLL
jgi:periplasmic protein TonB